MRNENANHNFAWGDPSGVRDCFISAYPEFKLNWIDPSEIKYGLHEGEASLRHALKNLFAKYGNYKHWLITAGCTQAIGAAIYALKTEETKSVMTRNLYFPFYPKMIALHSLNQVFVADKLGVDDIKLIDLPSNPRGLLDQPNIDGYSNIILDGAYLSETYANLPPMFKLNESAIFVGSLGKITGFAGLRIGFLATNNDIWYQKAYDWVCYGSIGTTIIGQEKIAAAILDQMRWEFFQAKSKAMIDANRYEISRMDHIFDGQDPSQNGMFAFFTANKKAISILEKASVKYVSGLDCGADYLSVRLNMGKSVEETRAMVDAVLKADRIR